jgi:hypothetical protein
MSIGSDAFISWRALFRGWLLDVNIEDGLIEGALDVEADRPDAADHREPRYFSISSIFVGGAALRNEPLNWTT